MKEQKVQTENTSGEILVGLESFPEQDNERYPAVLLVHGFGVDKNEDGMFTKLAGALGKTGILSYRFDFSGRGESDGKYMDTSLTKQRDDLKAILKFVKSQQKVDKSRIGIVGQSFGTPTSITLNPDIKSLVLMGSFGNVKEIMKTLFAESYNPSGVSTRVKSDGQIVKLNPTFWKEFSNHNIFNSIKQIKYPILFIHGQKDDIVPVSEMEALFKAANEPKEKVIIAGADHGLEPKRKEMYKIVSDWFKKTL